jgi:hypothetical protein
MKISCFVSIAALLLISCGVSARTWYITPEGAGNAPTIQAGIDSAVAADTVLLADGTYTGDGNRNITFGGKTITVMSESGEPQACIVDCEYETRGFLFDSGETAQSILDGVTITRGFYVCLAGVDSGGGGIWCVASSPTIRNAVVSNCSAEPGGGGMWCGAGSRPSLVEVVFEDNNSGGIYSVGSSPDLTDVTIQRNSGGGMTCEGGAPVLTDVVFHDNFGQGLSLVGGSGAILTGVVFSENRSLYGAGGLYCYESSPSVSNCTFCFNWCGMWGGDMRIQGHVSAPVVRDCTFYGNRADDAGSAIHGEGSPVFERLIIASNDGPEPFWWFGDCPSLMCCDIYGNAGGDWVGCISDQNGVNGNSSACPSFCNAGDGDFRLCDESPCLPGNHPAGYDCGLLGAWGEGCSCGPSRVETTTWGVIKSLYR